MAMDGSDRGRAMEITNREREVVRAWMELQGMGDNRKSKLGDTGNMFRFFAMVRNLMLWMDDLMRQMSTSEKPRDVSGVELLMNNHQGHKAEIDAREDNFADVYRCGKCFPINFILIINYFQFGQGTIIYATLCIGSNQGKIKRIN